MEFGVYGIQFKEITYDNGITGGKNGAQHGLYSCF